MWDFQDDRALRQLAIYVSNSPRWLLQRIFTKVIQQSKLTNCSTDRIPENVSRTYDVHDLQVESECFGGSDMILLVVIKCQERVLWRFWFQRRGEQRGATTSGPCSARCGIICS
jgi:hypothetical protein